MALFYLDTSALVKFYVREPGTERMLRLASREHNHRFTILTIAEVEFRSAVRRRERCGDIESRAATEIIRSFEIHLENRFLRVPLSESVLDTAKALVDSYDLRAYDAVQLAGCLILRITAGADAPVFVCADQKLLDTATALKLAVLDPLTA